MASEEINKIIIMLTEYAQMTREGKRELLNKMMLMDIVNQLLKKDQIKKEP